MLYEGQPRLTLAETIAVIEKLAIAPVMSELRYYKDDIEHEDPYDMYDAWCDLENRFDGYENEFSRAFVENMRDLYIAIKWARVVTDDELERTMTVGGRSRKKYWFKHRGLKYTFDSKEMKDE